MEEYEKIELRSEEVQEILGTPPGSIVRWGTTVAFLSVILMGFVSYWIKYPDKVPAPITITTSSPPFNLIATTNGYIAQLKVGHKEMVEQGQILVVTKSTADYEDILLLDSMIYGLQYYDEEELLDFTPPVVLELGDIQTDYSAFTQNFEDWKYVRTNGFEGRSTGQLHQQIRNLRNGIQNDKDKVTNTKKELEIVENKFIRFRQGYIDGAISRSQLENVKQDVFNLKRRLKEIATNIIDKETNISITQNRITEIEQGLSKSTNDSRTKLRESINLLHTEIEDWKQKYLLTTPISGVTSFHTYSKEQQFVQAGETVMSIIPIGGDSIVGTIFMPAKGSGKVKSGLDVILKMDGYPYEEYGSVRGKVADVSELPKDNRYRVIIAFPNGLMTSHKKRLPFSQEMKGSAEIITEKKRLITKIFEELIGRFENFN